MIKSLLKYKKQLKGALAVLFFAASLALIWFTVNAPERGRDAAAVAMERESASYFVIERDIASFARDIRSSAAAHVGLSAEFALVQLANGGRYYVRIDTQRLLVTELLKDKLAAPGASVIALSNVQPPAAPLAAIGQHLDPAYFSLLGPLVLLFVLYMMSPARGAGGMFRTVAKPETRFDDVVGAVEAKEALQDIVAYLRNPRKFSDLGGKPPKGVVLEGHYGTGKTLLARAVAGEAGVPFIALSGADFTDMFLGVGVRRVKKLFALARRQAPCVIFIDEIDGIGKRSNGSSAGETENNRIINTVLVELDGFTASTGIVVLGATNNVKNLDPAMIRAGRFDRTCHLGLPSVDEREQLFALYARTLRTLGNLDFRQLARLSTGLSPASIAYVVNAAALQAGKEEAEAVTHLHMHRALEQQLMGGPVASGPAPLNAEERKRIAVHEAGHAIVARLLGVGIVEKVSILRRGAALGVTLVTNNQDQTLQSEAQVRARMAMLLGGRAAEALILKSMSTGAANDLEHVSSMAYRMVTEFGFSKNIGPFSYAGLPDRERQLNSYPEAVAEARAIVKSIEQESEVLLGQHRAALEGLTAELLEHETVSGEVVDTCIRSTEISMALAA